MMGHLSILTLLDASHRISSQGDSGQHLHMISYIHFTAASRHQTRALRLRSSESSDRITPIYRPCRLPLFIYDAPRHAIYLPTHFAPAHSITSHNHRSTFSIGICKFSAECFNLEFASYTTVRTSVTVPVVVARRHLFLTTVALFLLTCIFLKKSNCPLRLGRRTPSTPSI